MPDDIKEMQSDWLRPVLKKSPDDVDVEKEAAR